MNQHAIVILYVGKELPESTAKEIVTAMCNDGVTTPELVTVKYYDGDSISDAIIRTESNTNNFNSPVKAVRDALDTVFKQIPSREDVAFQIRVAAFLGKMKVYMATGIELNEKDSELLTAIKTIVAYNQQAIEMSFVSDHIKIRKIKECYEQCW